MFQRSLAFLAVALAVVGVQPSPIIQKRIAQTIADSTAKWEQACLSAKGGGQCNPLSIKAFGTLLAAAGPCDQQNAADSLVDLSKSLNSTEMISLSQIFCQQPRNTPDSLAVPYCQQAPKNPELNGLFQCQFAGANQQKFVGGLAIGAPGTMPFGHTAPLNPLGSCPANPHGPIPDGQQLSDITTNPNAPNGSGAPSSAPAATPSSAPTSTASSAATSIPSAATAPPAASAASGFALKNGQAAQKLNAQFATLTANSPCTPGQNACVGPDFAQCVGGKFVTESCGSSLTCAALPLVNSAGTSITCTTTADALARIAATGATGGMTGSSGAAVTAASPASAPPPASSQALAVATTAQAPPPATSAAGGFRLQNGKDAQALNKQFTTLTANSPCTDGQDACVGGGFAQCVGSQYVVTQCAPTLTCAALPLVNKAGTSITCTTQADALARIQATGATGGISG